MRDKYIAFFYESKIERVEIVHIYDRKIVFLMDGQECELWPHTTRGAILCESYEEARAALIEYNEQQLALHRRECEMLENKILIIKGMKENEKAN